MRIYNSFAFENYKKLQQGCSSIFLMGECHPTEKKLRNSELGREVAGPPVLQDIFQ